MSSSMAALRCTGMFPQILCLLMMAASTAASALPPVRLPPDAGQTVPADELDRKRQREQLRSSVQQPGSQNPDEEFLPPRRQLTPQERVELRRLIERQQRPGSAPGDGR